MNRLRNRLLALLVIFSLALPASAETVARCDQGWLERIDGYLVLHLKGTPYEMGYQHGTLLKDHARANLQYLLDVKGDMDLVEVGPLRLKPRQAIETIVAEAIEESGADSPRDMGKVMKLVMPRVKGVADGQLVNEVVREKLQPAD